MYNSMYTYVSILDHARQTEDLPVWLFFSWSLSSSFLLSLRIYSTATLSYTFHTHFHAPHQPCSSCTSTFPTGRISCPVEFLDTNHIHQQIRYPNMCHLIHTLPHPLQRTHAARHHSSNIGLTLGCKSTDKAMAFCQTTGQQRHQSCPYAYCRFGIIVESC